MYRIGTAQVWVHDQDEALEFYTKKLGMEVRSDDGETAEQIRTLLAKGAISTVFLVTDDCHKEYEDLASRGVEFQETPEERPYGIDAGFRDPSGNNFRLTQLKDLG